VETLLLLVVFFQIVTGITLVYKRHAQTGKSTEIDPLSPLETDPFGQMKLTPCRHFKLTP
jgi:hypothetical protein